MTNTSTPQPRQLTGHRLTAHLLCQDPVFQGHLASFLCSEPEIYLNEVDTLFDAYIYKTETEPEQRESMKYTVMEFKTFLTALQDRAQEAKALAKAMK